MGQNGFKRLPKFQKFQLSNFTLTWSNEEKMNTVLYSKVWICRKFISFILINEKISFYILTTLLLINL